MGEGVEARVGGLFVSIKAAAAAPPRPPAVSSGRGARLAGGGGGGGGITKKEAHLASVCASAYIIKRGRKGERRKGRI